MKKLFIFTLAQYSSRNIRKKVFPKNIRNFFRVGFFCFGLGLGSAPDSPYIYYYILSIPPFLSNAEGLEMTTWLEIYVRYKKHNIKYTYKIIIIMKIIL